MSTEMQAVPPMPRGGDKLGAWFDAAAADAAVAFFPTYLRHTEAEWYNKPFELSVWQANFVRAVFGWKRADGTRLIRQGYLEVPRKNGKTEFAAGLSLLIMVADGEYGGQVYSIAVNKEQAEIVFRKAGVMVGLSPDLAAAVEVYKTALYCPELAASFKPLSSSPSSKHGFSPSGAVADELHEWPDGELHDVVHKGTAARRQPLEILITTAGQTGVGYGWELHDYALKVLGGEIEDPTFLPVIFAADPEADYRDPAAWKKANPNFGTSVKPDYLAAEVAKIQGNPRREANFRRFHLNQWVDQVNGGLPMDDWDKCNLRPVTLDLLAGRPCWGGLDLSSTTDLSALALFSPAEDLSGVWDVWWRFWLPVPSSKALAERVARDRVALDQWIKDGWIRGTEGDVIDYDVIRAEITGGDTDLSRLIGLPGGRPLVEVVDLRELAIDRFNATHITTQLTSDGVTVVPFGQGMVSMSAPSKEFERLVIGHRINHGGNPVARWMARCTTFEEDAAGNMKPVKPPRRKTPNRIDGIVAGIMALGRATAPQEQGGCVPASAAEVFGGFV